MVNAMVDKQTKLHILVSFYLTEELLLSFTDRSTEEFESIPYISKLLNAYFWVWYGIVKPNSVLVASVNGFGAALEIIYVIIFLIFAPPMMRVSFSF